MSCVKKYDVTTQGAYVDDFANNILSSGTRPVSISVEDDHTEALLKDFCLKTHIPLLRKRHLKYLPEAWESIISMTYNGM